MSGVKKRVTITSKELIILQRSFAIIKSLVPDIGLDKVAVVQFNDDRIQCDVDSMSPPLILISHLLFDLTHVHNQAKLCLLPGRTDINYTFHDDTNSLVCCCREIRIVKAILPVLHGMMSRASPHMVWSRYCWMEEQLVLALATTYFYNVQQALSRGEEGEEEEEEEELSHILDKGFVEEGDGEGESAEAVASKLGPEWVVSYDPSHKRNFYYNKVTNKSTWVLPGGSPKKKVKERDGDGDGDGKGGASGGTGGGEGPLDDWRQVVDGKGRSYYHSASRRKSMWTPEEVEQLRTQEKEREREREKDRERESGKGKGKETKASSSDAAASAPASDETAVWTEYIDPKTNQSYYHNKSRRLSSWAKPVDGIIVPAQSKGKEGKEKVRDSGSAVSIKSNAPEGGVAKAVKAAPSPAEMERIRAEEETDVPTDLPNMNTIKPRSTSLSSSTVLKTIPPVPALVPSSAALALSAAVTKGSTLTSEALSTVPASGDDKWEKKMDEITGRIYYYNKSRRVSSFVNPMEAGGSEAGPRPSATANKSLLSPDQQKELLTLAAESNLSASPAINGSGSAKVSASPAVTAAQRKTLALPPEKAAVSTSAPASSSSCRSSTRATGFLSLDQQRELQNLAKETNLSASLPDATALAPAAATTPSNTSILSPTSAAAAVLSSPREWEKRTDESTGQTFYYNKARRVSTFNLPRKLAGESVG